MAKSLNKGWWIFACSLIVLLIFAHPDLYSKEPWHTINPGGGSRVGDSIVVLDEVGFLLGQSKDKEGDLRVQSGFTAFKAVVPGSIAGSVTQADETTIEGAVVRALLDSEEKGTAKTDAYGQYTIPDLDPGTYTVLAEYTHPLYGLGQAKVTDVLVTSGETTTCNLTITYTKGAISGKVTSSEGAGIEGAEVKAIQGDTVVKSTTTNSSGQYTISDLLPAEYTVRVEKVGYVTKEGIVKVVAGETTQRNFALVVAPGAISGTVTSTDDTPVEGAEVKAIQGDTVVKSTTTNSSGQYTISDLVPGTYKVWAEYTHPLYGLGQAEVPVVVVISGETTICNLTITYTMGAISGQVTSSEGAGIEGAEVKAIQGDTVVKSTTTDANGQYTISDLDPGTYKVVAIKEGYTGASKDGVFVEAGKETTGCDLTLYPIKNPGILRVVVKELRSPYDPVQGADVWVMKEGTEEVMHKTTNEWGRCEFELSAGEYMVEASKSVEGYGKARRRVIIREEEVLEVLLGLSPIAKDDDGKDDSIRAEDGTEVQIPDGTFGKDGYVDIELEPRSREIADANEDVERDPLMSLAPGTIRRFTAWSTTHDKIHQFNKAITISIPFKDEDKNGIVDGTYPPIPCKDLRMYRLDETRSTWVEVPGSWVDFDLLLVKAEVLEMSVFCLIGVREQSEPSPEDLPVFPNPFYLAEDEEKTLTFLDLNPGSEVSIYDILGECVRVLQVDNTGRAQWNGMNHDDREKVGPGLYIYEVEHASGKAIIGKILVIRKGEK